MKTPRLVITLLALVTFALFYFVLTAVANCQDLPPLPDGGASVPASIVNQSAPAPAVPNSLQVFAVVMGFLVALVALARVIVIYTPTPKDNEFVEKCVEFLKKIGLHISIFLLSTFCFCNFTGCAVFAPKSEVTWEASRFLSFHDTWTVTLAAYDHAKDLQVEGKISAKDAADIDIAWNLFRAGYKPALDAAQGNEAAFTPANVKQLADDMLILIYAATN